MTRVKIIAGNWKMKGTVKEAEAILSGLCEARFDGSREVVICPSFPLLFLANQMIKDTNIKLGAQDCYSQAEGAFTGDVSPKLLSEVGCSHVILGHSERRKHHFESNYSVSKKAKLANEYNHTVLICVGENKADKDAAKTLDVVSKQVKFSLHNNSSPENTIIAYEPVWAIGSGETPENRAIEEVHTTIRNQLKTTKGEEFSQKVRILYGGSANASNASNLLSIPNVDGLLVGGASLNAEEFIKIVNAGI